MTDQAAAISAETFRRFQQGDEDAAVQIVTAYHRRLLGYLCVQTGNQEAADDLAQEVFLAAYQQRHAIRNEKALKAWLFTVASRKAARSLRRNPPIQLVEHDDSRGDLVASAPDGASPPWVSLHNTQADEQVRQALEALPPVDRDLVMLRYFGELSIKELADALDMPMGTVGVKLGRALAKMKTHLEKQGISLGDLLA